MCCHSRWFCRFKHFFLKAFSYALPARGAREKNVTNYHFDVYNSFKKKDSSYSSWWFFSLSWCGNEGKENNKPRKSQRIYDEKILST